VATGDGPSGFTFTPLNPAAKIEVGDQLATGPTGSTSYTPGLRVGTVRSVRTSADGTLTAAVTPAVSPTAVDLVAVVLSSGGQGSLVARRSR
jgi:cell shape-determining protein MreC